MKKSLFLLFFLLMLTQVNAQGSSQPFITTWKVSQGETITIPTPSSYGSFDFTINWGDQTTETYTGTGTEIVVEHTYADSGYYDVSIDGTFPIFQLNSKPAAKQIRDVKQWGDIAWTSLELAFRGADSLQISATDAPDLSGATSLYMMFMDARSFNSDISHWDVSTITNFRYMFSRATSFNQPLNDWDMSSAIYISQMFYGAASFNQDLNDWDVSNVNSLEQTFFQAYAFNGNISDWNTTNVRSLSSAFYDARAFNQPIGSWDVSNVRSMANAFARAYAFNQDLNNWDVTSVTDFFQAFRESGFEGDVSDWDVSGAANFNLAFSYLGDFPVDVSEWDISGATNLTGIFSGTNLTTGVYDSLLINWSQLSGLRTGLTFDAGGSKYSVIGEAARNTLINDLNWTINDAGKDTTITVPEEPEATAFITSWRVDQGDTLVFPTRQGINYNFSINWGDGAIDTVSGIDPKPEHIYAGAGLYDVTIEGSFPAIYLFNTEERHKIREVKQWGNMPWQILDYSFANTDSLVISATDTPDLSRVTNMTATFMGSSNFNSDISQWDVSNVTNMYYLFRGTPFNQDISGWDVSSVKYMYGVFYEATAFNQDISGWDVSNVEVFDFFLTRATSFNQDLSGWDVSSAVTMSSMFNEVPLFNFDIANWDVSNVTTMTFMFANNDTLEVDLSGWDISNAADVNNMFAYSTLTTRNYDSLLVGWSQLELTNGLTFDAGNSQYSEAGSVARQSMIDNFGWTINDGGLVEPETEVSNELNEDMPAEFGLSQNYPNPFNPSTNISFDLPQSSNVTLEVFDMMGKRVATLVNGRVSAGSHQVTFNATNLASGIYIYRLNAGSFVQTRKLTLIK